MTIVDRKDDRGARLQIALILAYVALLCLRPPYVLIQGRFWAEEGAVYFVDAWRMEPLAYLMTPALGYYSLFNKLASLLAALAPLEQAPLVTAWLAVAVQVWILLLLLNCGLFTSPARRMLAAALFAAGQMDYELFPSVIISQFHFALGCVLILIAPTEPTWFRRLAWPFLVLAALTGVLSVLLAPLFLLRGVQDRSPARLAQAAILGAGALLQAVPVVATLMAGDRHIVAGGAETIAGILLFKHLVLPWLPTDNIGSAATFLKKPDWGRGFFWVSWFVLFGGALAFCLVRAWDRRVLWLLAAAAVLSLASTWGALEADRRLLISISGGTRYYFVPSLLLGLAVLTAFFAFADRADRRWRAVTLVLVLMFIVRGTTEYFSVERRQSGPPWAAEVAHWRQDPSYRLRVWPVAKMRLAPDRRW